MPKVSKSSASSHLVVPGLTESHGEDINGWNVSLAADDKDLDLAPLFKGAPNNLCRASHLGYVIKGKFGVRKADGTEEIYEAGDAFVIEPGHTPLSFAGGEYVAFTSSEDAKWQAAVMMPNMPQFAKDQGVELPEDLAMPS
ncbi:hypothetical protein [Sinomonas sp. P10A9]|uniref:Cupin domain-containing protein n=1 Tax=Sinomonas puerhi TaxID=3238584 RepID=A0AB39L1V6_9MICC